MSPTAKKAGLIGGAIGALAIVAYFVFFSGSMESQVRGHFEEMVGMMETVLKEGRAPTADEESRMEEITAELEELCKGDAEARCKEIAAEVFEGTEVGELMGGLITGPGE